MKGIEAIHLQNFVNRDVKVENILIDQQFKVRIADMGWSAPSNGCSCQNENHDPSNDTCNGSGVLYQLAGTEHLLAPEIRDAYYPRKQ